MAQRTTSSGLPDDSGAIVALSTSGLRRYVRWLHWPVGRYLFVSDMLACGLMIMLFRPGLKAELVFIPALIISFWVAGLYRSRLTLSLLDDAPKITACLGAAVLVYLLLAPELIESPERLWPSTDNATERMVHLAALLTVLLTARSLTYGFVRMCRRLGWVQHRALIVGAGHVGMKLARTMQAHPEYGLAPIGFVDDDPRVSSPSELPAPLLAGYPGLGQALDVFRVRVVLIAFGTMREAQLVDVVRACNRRRCDIMVVPRLFEIHASARASDEIRGIPLVRVQRAAFRSFGWRLKRLIDLVICVPAVVALAPVLAACALAVRFSLGPGVLFRQERVGIDSRPFVLLKFRTLRHADELVSATTWGLGEDRRPAGVGAFLRRASLDELPQLWNVLRGDMSLVGPRPERPHFAADFCLHIPRYDARYRVPAGLTGWAQVNGLRGDTSIEERAAFDNYYIENWSLWLDVKILIRTVSQVLRGGGE